MKTVGLNTVGLNVPEVLPRKKTRKDVAGERTPRLYSEDGFFQFLP